MKLLAKILVGLVDKVNCLFEPFKMRDVTAPPMQDPVDPAAFYEFAKKHTEQFISSGGIFHDQKPDDIGDGLFYNALYQSWRLWDAPSKETAQTALATMRAYFTEFGCLVRGMCTRGAVPSTAHRPFYTDKFMADSDIGPGPLILWCYALVQIRLTGFYNDEVAELAGRVYQKLVNDNYWLLNPDGSRSAFGDLRMRFTQAPIQTLGVLLLAKLANHEDYSKIFDKYDWKVEFGDVHFVTWHPWYSEVIAFLAYDGLLALEIGPYRRKAYLRGLKRLFNVTKLQCNGLFYSIYAKYFGSTQWGKQVIDWNLTTFDETCKSRMATNNSLTTKFEMVTFKDTKMSTTALPIHARPSSNFAWNKNPFKLDGSTSKIHPYLDYLLLYAYPRCKYNV